MLKTGFHGHVTLLYISTLTMTGLDPAVIFWKAVLTPVADFPFDSLLTFLQRRHEIESQSFEVRRQNTTPRSLVNTLWQNLSKFCLEEVEKHISACLFGKTSCKKLQKIIVSEIKKKYFKDFKCQVSHFNVSRG